MMFRAGAKSQVVAFRGIDTERKEKMGKYVVLSLIVGSILLFGTASADNTSAEKAAVTDAETWLKLVDQSEYSSSWDEAAEYFKQAVTKKQWEQSIQAVRKPLGKIISRKLKSKNYMTSLPGAPDGKYVVIQFETSFENKNHAIETVTTLLDKDGKWRAAGYYIK